VRLKFCSHNNAKLKIKNKNKKITKKKPYEIWSHEKVNHKKLTNFLNALARAASGQTLSWQDLAALAILDRRVKPKTRKRTITLW